MTDIVMRARPVSATAFAVAGDRTEDYPAGRRLRLDHGAGSVVELGVVSAVFTGDVTTVTFERLGTAPRPHALPAASGWAAIAQHVHGLAARFETRRGALSNGGVIHSARRYDLLWGWLFSRTDAAVIARLGVRSADRVLDLGCGPGNLTRSIARACGPGGCSVGVDASPEMIARARRKTRGDRATFVESGAVRLPLADAAFDAAVSRLLLHELLDHELSAALKEIIRVVKPGGRVLLIDLPGLALDQARRELETSGHTFETGTVGFPFFHYVSFRAGR